MNAALNEATFLFTLWEGGGNIPPTIETARKLVAAGHRVRCLGDSCNRPEVEACGASFASWTRAPNRIDRSPESQTFQDWAAATPQEGLVAVIRDCWAAPSLAYAMDTVDELKRNPVDMVVAGEPLLGVMAGCESLGQPFVILGSAISFTPLPVHVLVTLGGAIRRDALRAADNCAIVDSAPHSVVMPQAAFVVTQDGHGTVIRALISRVPMLVIPLGRDQADNAVRVTQRGAGLSLPANAVVEQLRSACERLLTEPAFREAARRLGDLVAADAERSTVVQERSEHRLGAAHFVLS